ncbi:hypothetical protein D3OALGA1CA_515 [Olavius algarvensis associated proteobacterium Delta 3]|nr:hypothetical protein D3OALGB2SA_423 [Olavius algarvensis associated proteobacterium Delta 3]CAB5084973.1 hypothetical protein D3OALGA1CA_515 [Olavius algarvensis associated proteobacterium Delta 3]
MKLTAWGRYPQIKANGVTFETRAQLGRLLSSTDPVIPYGMGRSYGDSALNPKVILTNRFDKILGFDQKTGLLHVECGVTLADIIDIFLPRGWFLSVTPGTRFITVGGAISSDVHGKNHHKVGCFSRFVHYLELMLPSGDVLHCSPDENGDLFRATCGGMGLTGIILTAAIQLQPVRSGFIRETDIRCRNLEEAFHQFEANAASTYSVAWIDCLQRGGNIGRSILMLGEHADTGHLAPKFRTPLPMPITLPGLLLNRYSVAMFNRFYYRSYPNYVEDRLTPMEPFFYPLDRITAYGRMYGRHGFTQYQLALPKESSYEGLRTIMDRIAAEGIGSFLGVLKLLGPGNDNYLSFPLQGYTLALELKIEPRLFRVLDELDRIVLDHGGRLYLTKDVRMGRDMFIRGYPRWKEFESVREKYGLKSKLQSLQSERLGI